MDISEFRAAIEKMLQRSGWKTGSTGKVVLEVQLHQTEEREVEYQRLFGGGPSHEKLKFAPWKTTLRLLRDGELLWEHAYTPSSPHDLMSKNQTMQEKLRLAEVPDTDFLDRITLHPYITLPEYQNGYGRSTFETSGISDHPASTGP
jgi:hypothetical protein